MEIKMIKRISGQCIQQRWNASVIVMITSTPPTPPEPLAITYLQTCLEELEPSPYIDLPFALIYTAQNILHPTLLR
jgi:hypothetical protein